MDKREVFRSITTKMDVIDIPLIMNSPTERLAYTKGILDAMASADNMCSRMSGDIIYYIDIDGQRVVSDARDFVHGGGE